MYSTFWNLAPASLHVWNLADLPYYTFETLLLPYFSFITFLTLKGCLTQFWQTCECIINAHEWILWKKIHTSDEIDLQHVRRVEVTIRVGGTVHAHSQSMFHCYANLFINQVSIFLESMSLVRSWHVMCSLPATSARTKWRHVRQWYFLLSSI